MKFAKNIFNKIIIFKGDEGQNHAENCLKRLKTHRMEK